MKENESKITFHLLAKYVKEYGWNIQAWWLGHHGRFYWVSDTQWTLWI